MGARGKSLRRKASPEKQAKTRVLVYFEGEVTERIYMNGLKRLHRRSDFTIELGGESGEPLRIVKRAKTHAENAAKADRFDHVWCIFDVEAPKPHGSLEAAMSLAVKSGISCAISNPCFELWLVLHIQDVPAYQTTDTMCALAQDVVPGCNGKSFSFEDIRPSIGAAVERARKASESIAPAAIAKHNPATSMWKFLELLGEAT
jgi:hypothetical protein